MTLRTFARTGLVILAVGCLLPLGVDAQVAQFAPGSAMLSREELLGMLEEYELALQSPAYSERIKAEIRSAAERVRARLEHGDFQAGDRVALQVQGQNLPDTVPVEPGPKITLPLFGQISLAGVLRSELEDHLEAELGKMIRDPVVRASGLMRVSIQGAVSRPGFYVVPADFLISEALMLAGGPAQGANLEALSIERGGVELYGGEELQTAMTAGQTLDQLSLQAGDQIVLPVETPSVWSTIGRYALVIGSMVVLGVRIAG